MARIRTIKPEFPQSESMGRISREARLCFMLLWTILDDEGRARGSSRMLASLLYPYDDDAPKLIEVWLSELEREGCIVRYQVEGDSYIASTNWLKHQRIDKPSKSRLPDFQEASRSLAKPREASHTDLGPRTMDQDLETSSLRSDVSASQAKPPLKRERRVTSKIPEDCPTQKDRDAALAYWGSRGREDLCARLGDEVEAFRAHHLAHGKAMADWSAAWRTWYGNAPKFNRIGAGATGGQPKAKILSILPERETCP